MQKQPFNIKTLGFDILLCVVTMLVSEIVAAIVLIMLTGSREDGLENSIFLAVPLGTVLFYIIRRRFSIVITGIQIVITALATLSAGYLAVLLTYYTDSLNIAKDYWIVFSIASLVFIVTKHLSDFVVLNRTK
ncbi:MAG: hypothetical protein K0S26_669 [Bacteroidota bacterium]|nr:hypothetical protein [Bacteroidota bacterium]